jgi:hypothetical protein
VTIPGRILDRLRKPGAGSTLTAEQQTIRQAFNSRVYSSEYYDVQKGHLWDSLSVDAGEIFNPLWIHLFQQPVGSVDTRGNIRTEADTSLIRPGVLIAPDAFAIRRILFTFNRTASNEDVYAIAERTVWEFHMGNKRYLGSPMISLQTADLPAAPIRICAYCRSVYANEISCPGCGAREFSLSAIGGEAGRAFYLDIGTDSPGIVIENEIYFKVQFQGEPYRVSSPLKMWCHFEGLHARGIR